MKEEFLKIFNRIGNIISAIITYLNVTFGIEWLLFAGYLILNILDYVTGVIKAKVNSTESSSKGLIGIIKKVSYWILICLTFLISYLLTHIGQKINLNIDFIMFFGWFTLACLIINEARSILENLIDIGIKIPNFLVKGLEKYNELIENKSNSDNNTKE